MSDRKQRISCEFFPPKTLEASFRLWETVRMLAPLNPDFVSVTYGAGGTTRQLTHEAVTTIGREFGLLIAEVVDASDDERITPDESQRLREKWNLLRRRTEDFVRRCEQGDYGRGA